MAITPRSLIHCPLHLGAVTTVLPDQSCSLIHFLLSNQLLQLPNSVELGNSRIIDLLMICKRLLHKIRIEKKTIMYIHTFLSPLTSLVR
jgi:hypothetical protein